MRAQDIDSLLCVCVFNLEKLNTDAGKHELKKGGDNHDVPDGLYSHKHTLYHMLHTERERERE